MNPNTRPAAARAFVRSLNILLKFARMYDFGHPRTAKQYATAWGELRTALGTGTENEAGLLLGVSGDQLLLDGTPLESAQTEKSFARMLSAAGIASIHFAPQITQASLARFVKGFPTGTGSKPVQLAEQLKAALQDDKNIHVNEVCFVPADSAVAKSTVAAQLAAHTLNMNAEASDQLFNDPEKLLQLMVAAEGSKKAGNGIDSAASSEASPKRARLRKRVAQSDNNDLGAVSNGDDSENFSDDGEAERESFVADSVDLGSFFPSESEISIAGSPNYLNRAGTSKAPSVAPAGNADQAAKAPGGTVRRPRTKYIYADPNSAPPTRWPAVGSGAFVDPFPPAGDGSVGVESGSLALQDDEVKGILHVLGQIGRTAAEAAGGKVDPEPIQAQLASLPRNARFTVRQALSALAAQAPTESADKTTLLKLAEHIAIRYAMESYQRGDIEVNAVRHVLDNMSEELGNLRKIVGVYEEKMTRHGISVQSHADILAQQFWSQVPGDKRKAVLESSEAWCIPASQVREYVEDLLAQDDKEGAEKVLMNYADCVCSKAAETRRHTAIGIAELAPVYAKLSERVLMNMIRLVGVQLAEERDSELQSLMGAAFVRLSQEASAQRSYPAIQRSVELVDYVESERPGLGKNLRPRIAVEDRLPEFIEEAMRTGEVPTGLKDLLRRLPSASSAHLATRFSRAGFREDCDMLVSFMEVLDAEGLEALREQLRKGAPSDAIDAIGLLTRLDPEMVENVLPGRMTEWKRAAHDRVIRQIASSGSPLRGRLLLKLFDLLDPMIRPLAVDEIGISGEQEADMRLLRMAEGDLPKESTDYLQLKAIEALGRLRTAGAETVLRKIAEARKAFRWASPAELRLVAMQAMEKFDPLWVRSFIPKSGLSTAEFSIQPLDLDPDSSAMRQRRYPRLRMETPLAATTTNLKENCHVDIPELTLGGGVALCEQSLHPGSVVNLKLSTPQKSVKVQTIVRDANTQARAFEVVDIDLEERAKLRKLLVQLGNSQKKTSPRARTRRSTRTIS
ncbi:MAG: hypothetical protein WCA91_01700 [Candidatus Acidiferrales bacterium]